MSGHTKGCKKLNQQEAALPCSKSWGVGKGCGGEENGGRVLGKRERIFFCCFNSPKWLIRRSEESQGTYNGGSGTVGPEHRNEGREALLLHYLTLCKAVTTVEQYLSLELKVVKCLQLSTISIFFCPHPA